MAIEVWRQSALAAHPGEAAEGPWWTAVLIAMLLGFPTNLVVAPLLDPLSTPLMEFAGVDPFYLLLGGVVANWALWGWCVATFPFSHPASDPRERFVESDESATPNVPP